jgi:hypothetical protein
MFDILRPGVSTGFQTKSETLKPDYMWYSPTETSAGFEMLRFTKSWFSSYHTYSSAVIPVFVDFGSGPGKINIIAWELGFPISIAFDLDQDLLSVAEINFKSIQRRKKRGGC